MHTFHTTDSRRLSYQRDGKGPLVVMLPGGPGLDPMAYYSQGELPGFQQLLFCPRGTGESDLPTAPDGYRIAGYVDDLEELRQHLGLEQLNLYGSSHGASTAFAYAAAFPGCVGRMVLASGPGRMDGRFLQAVTAARERFCATVADGGCRLERADAAEALMRSTANDEVRREALPDRLSRFVAQLGGEQVAFLDQLCQAPVNFAAVGPMGAEWTDGLDLLSSANSIVASTLVLAGALDTVVPAEHMSEIAEAIPGARFVSFEASGHFIHAEAHERWGEVVSAFFRST